MKRYLSLLAIPAALAISASAAHALPPAALPTVTCETITIDPEPGMQVAFDGTIGSHTDLHLVATPIPGTVLSSVSIADLTTATGEIHWSLTPVWTIPPNPYGVTSGNGPTTEGVLTCHEEPTSTTTSLTSSTTSTTISSTTTSVAPTSSSTSSSTRATTTSTAVSGISVTPSTQIGKAITATPSELPFTGASHTNAEFFGGAGLLALGLTLAKRRRR